MPPPYHPLGHCLYCGRGSREGYLTREHILALSLGGTLVLPQSSCVECAAKTRDFETTIARKVLLDIRTHWNLKTRNPKNRPTELSTTAGPLAVERHPPYLFLQEFERPGILLNQPSRAEIGLVHVRVHTAPHTGKRHVALGDVGVQMTLSPNAMMLTLAKTAHAFAVAELGEAAFDATLPALILGKAAYRPSWLVGSIPRANLEVINRGDELPPLFHTLELRQIDSDIGERLLTCEITLFKLLRMPVYQVVFGIPKTDFISGETISSITQDL